MTYRRSGGGASFGLASARPAATGSGSTYVCQDIGIIYVDDPATGQWKGTYTDGYVTGAPGLIANYIVVGSLGLVQKGDSFIATSQTSSAGHHALKPIPGNVTSAGPWTATIAGGTSFTRNSTYPEFGICISNGVTASSSNGLFWGWYCYNSNTLVPGCWKEVLNTQTRSNIYFGDNAPWYWGDAPFYFRILNDGTNLLYQYSHTKGLQWRTIFTNTFATVGLTFTHYGLSAGCMNGAGYVTGTVNALSMVPITSLTVTNVTFASSLYTVTTSTSHGLVTGDSVSILAVTGSGTSPNGLYENTVISTGANTFTVPGASFTYTSGGTVTLTSR